MKKYLLIPALMLAAASTSFGQLHVTTGTAKNVLLEEADGAWTGWTPDGQQDIIQSVSIIPHAICLSWHSADSMMIPGDPFCTGSGFMTGFPTATIDRYPIGGAICQNRPWESAVSARTSLTPNFKVDMTCSYNPSTRVMDIVVTGQALATLTGNWNINAFIAEDSIAAVGSGYEQHNYLTSTSTACNGMPCWFNGLPSILLPSTYSHMNVVRHVCASGGSIWGDAAFTNPVAGTSSSRTYSFTLPASYNASKVFVVGLVQKTGTGATDTVIENAVSTKGGIIPPGIPVATSDSMDVYTNDICSVSDFYITTHSYTSGMTIHTSFGDGTTSTTPVLSTLGGGYVDINHSYGISGTFTVKHVLYSGTTPLDSISYSKSYVLCNQFPVMFYYDGNGNCSKDSTEPYIYQPFLTRVDSNGITIDSISSTSGFYYNAYGDPGDIYTFTVMHAPPGLSVTCPSGGVLTDTVGVDSVLYPKYFGATCLTGAAFDLRVFALARAGRHHFGADIIVDNTYCAYEPATVTIDMSPHYNYAAASITPSSITGSTITWNLTGGLSSVQPGPTHISLGGEVPGTWLTPGDTVHSHFHIGPVTGDSDPTNNDTSRVDTVRSAYDPNYMEVTPSGYIPAATPTLQYTIEFENTGNDTAHNVYVMDTLSPNVVPSSLKILTSSAKMFVSSYRDLAGRNIVKFDFPGINLLDSTHHNLCTGLVAFNVNLKSGLADGTTIFNHAGIFFDDNPVVMTNTVEDIIGLPNRVNTINNTDKVTIGPNPANDHLTISMDNSAFTSFTISNAMGQEFMNQTISGNQTKVDIKTLPAGLYYIMLKGDNGTRTEKFIKL